MGSAGAAAWHGVMAAAAAELERREQASRSSGPRGVGTPVGGRRQCRPEDRSGVGVGGRRPGRPENGAVVGTGVGGRRQGRPQDRAVVGTGVGGRRQGRPQDGGVVGTGVGLRRQGRPQDGGVVGTGVGGRRPGRPDDGAVVGTGVGGRRPGRPDDGSIVIAMTVMLVLTVLSIGVLARSLVSLTQVRRGQDFVAALAAADGGLSDALFRIDQSNDPTIAGAGAVGGGSFEYVATRQSNDRYIVQVKGAVNGSEHAVEATVSRRQKFPYALFSNQGLTLNGNNGFDIYSFETLGGPRTGGARLGSNRAIVVNSGQGAGDFQDYYAPSGSCIGCPNPVAQEGPYVLDPIEIPTTGTQTCAPLGVFTGVINGQGGVPIVCDMDVTFSGTVTVINPPALVYITASHALRMADSVVNEGGRGNYLQIYKEGSGSLELGNGAHATEATAVLYAPESVLTINGGEEWYGSITVNSVKVNGAPNFTLGYDQNLKAELTQDWRVSHWHEVPSASVGF